MNNWNGNRGSNTSNKGTVQNFATGQKTELPKPEKKRVKIGAGWNGQYGPSIVLDIKSLLAIARLLEAHDTTEGSLKLRFYENKNKTSEKSPDFTLVTEHIRGVYDGQGGYEQLEVATKQEEQVPF